MKLHPETSPLTKRFERCPRMAQVDQAGLLAADAPGRFRGDRGVRSRGGRPCGEKVGEQRPARRFPQVFGVRLECKSPDDNMASVEVAEAHLPAKKSTPSPSFASRNRASRSGWRRSWWDRCMARRAGLRPTVLSRNRIASTVSRRTPCARSAGLGCSEVVNKFTARPICGVAHSLTPRLSI